jgi:hypothetical protein
MNAWAWGALACVGGLLLATVRDIARDENWRVA